MRLSDMFKPSSTKPQVSDGIKTPSPDIARTAYINRQIRSLMPGQIIQGEVVGKDGNELQIRLADDMVLTARLAQNTNLEIGKGMVFQVRNNGTSLVLNPLFANTATDANVLKALQMAELPVNQTTVVMTQSLMEAGLSIDKNSLQNVFREMGTYSHADLKDIVDLHKLGMPVTEDNLSQMASYKNLTHQLVSGLTNIMEEIPATFQNMVQNGEIEGAIKLYQALMDQLSGHPSSATPASQDGYVFQDIADESIMPGMPNLLGDDVITNAGKQGDMFLNTAVQNHVQDGMPQAITGKGKEPTGALQEAAINKNQSAGSLSGISINHTEEEKLFVVPEATGSGEVTDTSLNMKLQGLLNSLNLPEAEYQELSGQLNQLQQNNLNPQDILQLTGTLLQLAAKSPDRSKGILGQLLSDQGLNRLLMNHLKESWTVRPDEVKEGEKIEALYSRLNRQLHNLAETLESSTQAGSNMSKSVNNMSQNLDFLQQLNQMYTYVQLPLRMNQNTAHGDLYVYANKKHLASSQGNISALLHLDMEHLGPVDIYVSMQSEKVSTRFYVQDDSMLDFLAKHMDILNKRLQEKGYDLKYEMTIRKTEGAENTVLKAVLQENASGSPIVQYAFDVRA